MLRHQIRNSRIDHIFISHLHGDHYLGLMGLIFTYHLQGRTDDLHVYGPLGLDEIITVQLKYSESQLSYVLHFHIIKEDNQLIFENDDIQIITLKMNHRIPCYGLIFEEKLRKFKLIRERLPANLTKQNMLDLKEGKDITDGDGKFWENTELALAPPEPRKYVYCADTRVLPGIDPRLEGVNLLYHEATFTNDMQARAEVTFHTTAEEAGEFARRHKVRQLLIGHFSSRYSDLSPFLKEAQSIFKETILAFEGQTFDVHPVHPLKTKESNVEFSIA
jgi:ribonuclease Z